MRRLGIDFGTKKVGLALTDASGTLAFPHSVIPNDTRLLATMVEIITDSDVEEVVIGHSISVDGTENKLHELVKVFITELTLETPVPVHLEPEQFSTQQAIKSQGRTDHTDASAAAIILQSFIDKQTSRSAFDDLNE